MQSSVFTQRFFTTLIALIITTSLFAQTGKVSGKITDAQNKAVVGATVKLTPGDKSVISDVDGHFVITVTTGVYQMEITAVGFQTKKLTEVDVKDGQVNDVSILMETNVNNLSQVTVSSSSARKETTNALIQFQKNTNAVAQVISAEAIRRSPDRNTGEALKRVTGLSIQEGRYIVVRGLSDRYNQAMLNGVLLSSTEPDRKTFSFDIFPSAIVDNIIVNKTFIPEYSAEWAGGLIQVNTKDIPTSNFFNLQIGTNFNTNTVGKDFYSYKGGKLDFLGMDDGTRALPDNLPTKNAYAPLSEAQKTELASPFAAHNWNYNKKSGVLPVLGQSLVANGGFRSKIFKKDLGGIFTLTYNRNVRNLEYDNSLYGAVNGTKADPSFVYNNNKYSQDILWGALANFSLKLNPNNKISFRNLFNINTSDYTTIRTGRDFESNSQTGENVFAYELGFRNNTFFNTQLNGEHNIPSVNMKFNWFGSFTIMDQYIPGVKRLQYNQAAGDDDAPYLALLSNTLSQKAGSIFYQNLNDYIYNFGGDLAKTFTLFDQKQTIKGGYNFQVKDRLFDARPFSIYLPSNNNTLRALPGDQIFAPENFGTAPNQFHVDELSGIYFRYLANTILNAGFIQLDNNFTKYLRVVWGVRYENYDQLVGSTRKSDPRYSYTKKGDFLPAVNATFKLNNKTNLRVSGSQTLVRPEFRELTATAYYDFEIGATTIGNPNLIRTKITNADIRYEIYPSAGELFTIGGFYKYFQSPIELYLNQSGAGSSNIFNFIDNRNTTARSYGAELEFRKKLDFVGMKNFLLSGNFSYIYNRVKTQNNSIDRPMQGQSPYLINASLQYDPEVAGLNFTILFNQVGRRILLVGGDQIPSIWEAPRPLLDLQIAKKVLKSKGEIKMNISDIINQRARFYHDLDVNNKFNSADALAISRLYGTNVSLSFQYNFK